MPVHESYQSCGYQTQLRTNYKTQDFTCNFRKRTGHLENVCRQKNQRKKFLRSAQAIHQSNHVNIQSPSLIGTTRVELRVNDHCCILEVNTRANKTIVNIADGQRSNSPDYSPVSPAFTVLQLHAVSCQRRIPGSNKSPSSHVVSDPGRRVRP
jgi:hypothetical protein